MEARTMFETAKIFHQVAANTADLLTKEAGSQVSQEEIQKIYNAWLDSEDDSEEAFQDIMEPIQPQIEMHLEYIIPIIVNASFACELYMKSILVKSGLPVKKLRKCGHKLDELFYILPDGQRNDIQKRMYNRGYGNEFELHLGEISNAFIEWRYWFEGTEKCVENIFLGNFCDVLEEVADRYVCGMK